MMITVEERFMNSDRVGRKGVSFVSISEKQVSETETKKQYQMAPKFMKWKLRIRTETIPYKYIPGGNSMISSSRNTPANSSIHGVRDLGKILE